MLLLAWAVIEEENCHLAGLAALPPCPFSKRKIEALKFKGEEARPAQPRVFTDYELKESKKVKSQRKFYFNSYS